MSLNPCACIGVTTQVAPEVEVVPLNCLKLCHVTILSTSDDAVGPCGKTGTKDISDENVYGHDTSICGANVKKWSVKSYTEELASANISSAGVLTWVTGNSTYAGKYATVIVELCCGEYSKTMTVLIGIKQLCGCIGCEECENCDPCTGDCLDGGVDINIGGSNE